MCGISGYVNFNENYKENFAKNSFILGAMGNMQYRRGKDAFNTYVDKNVCFAHNRLSIRDIENGSQPMHSDDGLFTIVYNGEIYNTDALKDDLIANGFSFTSTSDTEIILKAYMHYGIECTKHIEGIFAFAIFDKVKNRLFLCRDRFGIKPLFYAFLGDTLIFGSTIASISAYSGFTLKLNNDSYREIFGLFPSRTEGSGLYEGVFEIEYGGYAIFDKNGFSKNKYWNLSAYENEYSYDEAVLKTKELVTKSVLDQTVSDVPISTFLSGGLDSSVITAIIANEFKKDGRSLDTFSFDFEENSLYFKSSEFQVDEDKLWVSKMSEAFSTNHTYLECNIDDLFDGLYKAVDAKGYPSMTDIDSSLLYFCNIVGKTHKVTLTGECADEIFGGYPWFYKDLEDGKFPWIRDMNVRQSLLDKEFCKELDLDNYVKNAFDKTILEQPKLASDSEIDAKIRTMTYLNIKWFMTTLLERMDTMSMYGHLEARVPYANSSLIEFLYNTPWDYKYRGTTKNLLREAFKDTLPHELVYRKKSPYPKTYNPKYEKMLEERLLDIVYSNDSPILSFVDRNKVVELVKSKKDLGKPWFGQLMATPQLMAYYIQLDYFLRKLNKTA